MDWKEAIVVLVQNCNIFSKIAFSSAHYLMGVQAVFAIWCSTARTSQTIFLSPWLTTLQVWSKHIFAMLKNLCQLIKIESLIWKIHQWMRWIAESKRLELHFSRSAILHELDVIHSFSVTFDSFCQMYKLIRVDVHLWKMYPVVMLPSCKLLRGEIAGHTVGTFCSILLSYFSESTCYIYYVYSSKRQSIIKSYYLIKEKTKEL